MTFATSDRFLQISENLEPTPIQNFVFNFQPKRTEKIFDLQSSFVFFCLFLKVLRMGGGYPKATLMTNTAVMDSPTCPLLPKAFKNSSLSSSSRGASATLFKKKFTPKKKNHHQQQQQQQTKTKAKKVKVEKKQPKQEQKRKIQQQQQQQQSWLVMPTQQPQQKLSQNQQQQTTQYYANFFPYV